MNKEEIDKIIESCKAYASSPYLGSDGFHHKYGDKSISIEKLREILNRYLTN